MKAITIAQPFANLVGINSEKFPWMGSAYAKVRKVVRQYATHRSVSLSKLPLADVMNETGGLHPELEKFINCFPRPQRRTPARHKEYKEEAKARLRRVVAALSIGIVSRRQRAGDTPHDKVADFMMPVLDVMSRVGGGRLQGTDESIKRARSHLPLSEDDRLVLPLFLRMVKKYELTGYEAIFLEHRHEVYQLIRETYPECKWYRLRSRVGKLRRRLGIRPGRKRESLELAEFPPKLKNQCETYMKNAEVGLEQAAPELADLARGFKVNVGRSKKKVVEHNIEAIGMALSRMPSIKGKDIDVEDLLRLSPVERVIRGKVFNPPGNPYIEEVRAHERGLVSRP